MKTAIMYYYDIDNPTIYKIRQVVHIKDRNSRYIVQPIQSDALLNEIYTILVNNDKINQYYEIMPTKNKQLSFSHNGVKFALIKIKKNTRNYEQDIINPTGLPSSIYQLDRSNWYFLWCKKCDYLQEQAESLEKKFNIASEPIDYYMGMAETAIAYLKNNTDTTKKIEELSICHRRINSTDILNPLNIVVDKKERDISEYLKYIFINKKETLVITRKILIESKLEKESLIRLFARMLYPSYFFDIYEKIINNYENEHKILEIVKRIDEYECYLRELYNEINKIEKIKRIDWL